MTIFIIQKLKVIDMVILTERMKKFIYEKGILINT